MRPLVHPRIVLLGYGNLGYHLADALLRAGLNLVQIYNRSGLVSPSPGKVSVTTETTAILPDAEIYLLCVRDEAIGLVAEQLSHKVHRDAVVAHTSGAAPLEQLARYFPLCGVFWPVQSFSRQVPTDFSQVPICVAGTTTIAENTLLQLGRSLSNRVYSIDHEERPRLHLAAVLANNFTNALYDLAARQLEQMDLPFDLLRPLILQTALKVQEAMPVAVQTGPAIRNDRSTLLKHLALLEQEPELRELYRLLSKYINPKLEQL